MNPSSLEYAEAQAILVRRYWEMHGATASVTVRPERFAGYSLRVTLGADGLPGRWTSPKHRRDYILRAKQTLPALLQYINSEILPAHNRMVRTLDF